MQSLWQHRAARAANLGISPARRLPIAALALACLALLILLPRPATADPPGGNYEETGYAPWESAALARIDSLRLATQAGPAMRLIEEFLPRARVRSRFYLALRVREGELWTSVGQTRKGEEVLRPTLDLAWALGDTAQACAAMRWLAVAVGGLGRIDEMAGLCTRLLEIARARGDHRHEGWAFVGLAWVDEQKGRGRDGAEKYRSAIRAFRAAHDARSESWAQNGLGLRLAAAGSYSEARRAFARAVSLARETGYVMVEALAADGLGKLEYDLGDPAAGAALFARSAEIHRRLGEKRISMMPQMDLALCDIELGRYGPAADTLETLLARSLSAGYAGLEVSTARRLLARVRELQGRHGEADRLRRRVLDAGPGTPMAERIEAAAGLAASLVDRDSAAAALSMLEGVRAEVPHASEPESRIQLETALGQACTKCGKFERALGHLRTADDLARGVRRTDQRIDALAGAARAWHALGREDSARASLQQAAMLWEAERSVPRDPEWREQRGLAGRMIGTELSARVLATEGAGAAYETAQLFKARTLLERMAPSELGPDRPLPALAAVIPLDRLQREILREDELLLDFFLGPERSLLFAITKEECRAFPLPADAELGSMIRLYHGLVAHPPSADAPLAPTQEAAQSLRRELLGEVEPMIASQRSVLVCPDGVVNLVPFAALDPPGGSLTSWVCVPSASILARLRSENSAGEERPGRLLALAAQAGKLMWARREAAAIARAYRNAELRLVADTDTVRADALSGAGIVHLAAHVATDDERPWRTAIDLGAYGLPAEEIARTRMRTTIAFLSGCRSSHSRVLSGEGALGLSAAFLSAGASCVVGTLWPVDDRVTARLVRLFYRELAAGGTAAQALRRSQDRLRADPATAHPFYWAGFVPIGEGEVRFPMEKRRAYHYWVGVAAIGLVLVLAGIWRRRA
jgi:tetratricopeptide (TPR) repeat protein